MSGQLQTLREQIQTAHNLQSVVQTMRALAEVNVRRAEVVAQDSARYARALHVALYGTLQALAQEAPRQPRGTDARARGAHLPAPEPKGLLAVVVTSDQGLCGPFNERITSYALHYLQEEAPDRHDRIVVTVGVRGCDRLQAAGERIVAHCDGVGSVETASVVVSDVLLAVEPYLRPPRPRRLVLISNRLHQGRTFRESHMQLFPADMERWRSLPPGEEPFRWGPLPDVPPQQLLGELVREHLYADLFQALVESFAAEHAARLSSMRSATENIKERLEELEAEYRRQWQDAVTQELMDVMGGVEAVT